MSSAFERPPAYSGIWHPDAIEEIQEKAELGRYQIRGQATKRLDLPSFDDLVFTPAGLSRMPLEGYRERCDTEVVIGEGRVSRPLVLERPIMIAGMSFGALSVNAKRALGIAAHPDFEVNTIHTRWLEHTYLAEFEMNEGETVDGAH